jgi:hypothetical protein
VTTHVHIALQSVPPLLARGNRKLKMTFEDQLNGLILYHMEEYDWGRHLLQVLKEDRFALNYSIPTKLFLTDGKPDERPFVSQILSPGRPASWIVTTNATETLTSGRKRENILFAGSGATRERQSSRPMM